MTGIEPRPQRWDCSGVNMDNLDIIPDDDMQLNIDFDTFLEMVLMRTWGETIKFSTKKKEKTPKHT